MSEQPCRSFLKLFTISSGSLAKELQRDFIWDVLSLKKSVPAFSLKEERGQEGEKKGGQHTPVSALAILS